MPTQSEAEALVQISQGLIEISQGLIHICDQVARLNEQLARESRIQQCEVRPSLDWISIGLSQLAQALASGLSELARALEALDLPGAPDP
jgi:hypothetical protein